jgi:hypothetical protein
MEHPQMSKLFSIHRLSELLDEAKRDRLFGKIVLEFNDGDLKLIRKESTYKINHSNEEDHSSARPTQRH